MESKETGAVIKRGHNYSNTNSWRISLYPLYKIWEFETVTKKELLEE
jgi:hypothetical protein